MQGNKLTGILTIVAAGILLGSSVTPGRAQVLPAFPGAQGFGTDTPGGRGGKTLLVSNLNDSGPGSFRAACGATGRRFVLFHVSGIINLESPVSITEPFITIAGQTAPGDGIVLRRFGLAIGTHDVVVRFLRVRPGDVSGQAVTAIDISGESHNVVIDHCSASWSADDAVSAGGGVANLTIQWSILAESLSHSTYIGGPHSYGSFLQAAGGVSLHHNIWAHNNTRNPGLGVGSARTPAPVVDIHNNVMYNYGESCTSIAGGTLNLNFVGNYIKPGPDSNRRRGPIVVANTTDARCYLRDNDIAGNDVLSLDNSAMFERWEARGRRLVTVVPTPFDAPRVNTLPSETAYKEVLSWAGALRPKRDAVDERIVDEVRNGTGAIIDSQWEVGGWPEYRGTRPPRDTDRDGIPDSWEQSHGLNPADASDAARIDAKDGYSYLEDYLNELAAIPLQPWMYN